MKTMSRIYLIFAILLGIIGAVQFVRWLGMGTGANGLINFLPAGIFLGAYIWSRTTRWKRVHAVSVALCLAVLLSWGTVTLVVEAIVAATAEVTDVKRYGEILDGYWSSEQDLVSHFPRPIPSEARDARFSFLPKFLQGGAHVQLRYAASPEAIGDLYDRFSAMSTKSFSGGDWNEHVNAKEGMPTTFFHTSGSKERSFPRDYEIMAFDQAPTDEERRAGMSWNHGRSHGVAISRERSEIVYWAEAW